MAGGKETPRQKMIGMMYLVLTALLALNVSKSVLDAFVAIEENIQKANIVQFDRGAGFVGDVEEELQGSKGADQAAKRKKLNYVLDQMAKIDKESESMINLIDKLKVDILKEAGENVATYKNQDELTILWKKGEKGLPARMHLAAVEGQDKYDEPMLVLGINDNIKKPTGKGLDLWKKYNDFRTKIVEMTGNYSWGDNSVFSIKPTAINDFKDNKDLTAKVEKMVDGSKANLKEDRQVLIDLYMMLTKKEKNDVHDQKDVHWIGMTFDHSPLVAAIASLSSLQQDILSARALAMAHWKSKVSTGEYSFNKIMPLAYAPAVVNQGDAFEIKVMMAAFDSDNQPTVTSSQGSVTYPGNGQGIVKVTGGAATMKISGTVSIKNKSGVPKTDNWDAEVVVMKPSGSIELPEMNMLYRSYPNKVNATASGFPKTGLTGSGVSISASGEGWIVKPTGTGRTASLSVTGTTADGKTTTLKTMQFRCSNLPDPELYWGAVPSGGKGSKAETKLFAKYPPEIPLNAVFTINTWECQVPGAQGKPPGGSGSNISAASNLLRAAPAGSQVSFICTVVGPDGVQRKKAGAFKI